ncbi:MAG: PH domain-containing protein [Bacteroidetes bacterium]|nr:PH domain-containing protein [Bacteroidota bacterium]
MASLSDFSAPRSLHPFTLVMQFIRSLPALLLLLAPTIIRGSAGETRLTLTFALMYAVITVPLIIIRYLRFRYWIEDDEIVVHSGVLTRRKRNIPMDRIQNIEIQQSLLPRLMGMAQVRLDTAGSASSEGQLEYVSLNDAHAIRQTVREFQRAEQMQAAVAQTGQEEARGDTPEAAPLAPAPRLSTDALQEGLLLVAPDREPVGPTAEDADDASTLLFSMPPLRVVLMGAYRFSLLFIALLLSATQYLQLDPEEMADLLFRGPFQEAATVIAESPWLYGSLVLFVAAVLSWLTGIITTFVRYYGFKLWLDGDKLQRKHGLLTLQEGTIPLQRVQTLILRSNPFMEWRGWFRLELQTMGYDVDEQGYHVVVPFAQREALVPVAENIRPLVLPDAFHSVSPITIRRHFVRYTVALLALVVPIAQFWGRAWWGLALLPFLGLFAYLHYRHHGYATTGNMLFIRRGVIRRYIFAVPLDKMQVFMNRASIFQRRLGLKSLSVDTAGSASVTYPEIVDLPAATADALLQRLHTRFQRYFRARRAGDPPTDLLSQAAAEAHGAGRPADAAPGTQQAAPEDEDTSLERANGAEPPAPEAQAEPSSVSSSRS